MFAGRGLPASLIASAVAQATASGALASSDSYPTTFDYYLSPSGSDSNDGLTTSTPWKTFAKLQATSAVAGKRVGLLSGTYSVAAGTGCLNFNTSNSGIPPSGTSTSAMTELCAVTPYAVTISGAGEYQTAAAWIGRSTRKDSYMKFRGIRFYGGVYPYNSSFLYFKQCAILGEYGAGTNDTSGGSTLTNADILVEDCWIWNKGSRVLMSNYDTQRVVMRRVVMRPDGGGPLPGGGNPNVACTIYNSREVSYQNCIVIDRILTGGEPYSDFGSAQHDNGNSDQASFRFGNNEWLGCISVNSEDDAFTLEIDGAYTGVTSWRLKDCIALPGGFSCNPGSGNATTNSSYQAENLTAYTPATDAFRFVNVPGTSVANYLRNSIGFNASRYGSNVSGSGGPVSYLDLYNNASGNNGTTPTNSLTTNPRSGSPNSLTYPLRVETGSALKGAGLSGADMGANVEYCYGVDGTFYGDTGYNTLTSTPLWPWPNEAQIKADMGVAYTGIVGEGTPGSVTTGTATRGFCAAGESLTHYIWNWFGNGSPY